MKVKKLRLNNFRGIQEMDLEFDKQINLIVGNNGYGKSTILDALAILLSRLISRIRSSKGTGRFFTVKDIKDGESEILNKISVNINEELVTWQVRKNRGNIKTAQKITNQEELRNIANRIQNELDENPELNLPLSVYYSVNRAVIDVQLRINKRHDFNQLSAYDNALSGTRNDFRLFFEWFRKQEDYENEQRLYPKQSTQKKLSVEYRDPQLQAVRTAIYELTGFSNIRIKRNPLRMEAQKNNSYFDIKQLSDGEKCLLAMVGDLARRLSIANPGLHDPLQGQGVVLIDEIDLHLHPEWQRRVIPALIKVFPSCQFIVSTHSPQILANVKPENIFILTQDGKYEHPTDSYGWNSDSILEDIMGTTSRPKQAEEDLNRLFELIKNKKQSDAQSLLETIENKYGKFPELSKANVLIRHLEMSN